MRREFELKTVVVEYDSVDELSDIEQELMKKAHDSGDKAYAPYSNFYVGAALLLENGKIITGNNQENIAYPSGLCAERTAIFSAGAQYPDEPIKIMAITAKSAEFKVDKPISPCGACRQVIAEYELRHSNDIKILLMGEVGSVYEIGSIKELLPLVFNEKGLRG
ncbi:MAG: cytidine deaminase [Flavobacteriales bacterium]|nr:cytidine deaminase [Flavobacteriales bacterium]